MTMRVLVVTTLLGVTATAHAAPPGLTLPERDDAPIVGPGDVVPPSPTYLPSYRAETLAADGIAITAMLLGGRASAAIGLAGLGTYALGGPLVHLRHGNGARATGSLAMRLLFPVIGAGLATIAFRNGGDDEEAIGAIVVGGGGGMLLAIVLDSAVLAGDYEAPRQPTWVPSVRATQGGYTMGVSTAF